jgi:hypothetical protein
VVGGLEQRKTGKGKSRATPEEDRDLEQTVTVRSHAEMDMIAADLQMKNDLQI